MTNQLFCYWLQGYFEISRKIAFTQEKILQIKNRLETINEPLGEFTQWLSDVVNFLVEENYKQGLVNYFLPIIRDRLNGVFYHVIDRSYETLLSVDSAKKIHDGYHK